MQEPDRRVFDLVALDGRDPTRLPSRDGQDARHLHEKRSRRGSESPAQVVAERSSDLSTSRPVDQGRLDPPLIYLGVSERVLLVQGDGNLELLKRHMRGAEQFSSASLISRIARSSAVARQVKVAT